MSIAKKIYMCLLFFATAFCYGEDSMQTNGWNALIAKPGCLISATDIRFSSEGSIFCEKDWREFLEKAKTDRNAFVFVLDKFSSERSTKIHICNFDNANEGLLAVFVAQQITQTNWSFYDGDRHAIKNAANDQSIPQANVLKKVLKNSDNVVALQDFFMKQWENQK